MNIKLGDLIIHRTLTDVHDNQFLYVEKIYIVLAIDGKQITTVPSVDWICGYQRDLCHDYDTLLGDGFSMDVLDNKDVRRSNIFKKLDSSTFQLIGYEYCWFNKDKEMSACVPYTNLTYSRKEKGYRITRYDNEFAEAMTAYPSGNENYVFGKRYTNFIIPPFNVEDNVHTLGNKIPKK